MRVERERNETGCRDASHASHSDRPGTALWYADVHNLSRGIGMNCLFELKMVDCISCWSTLLHPTVLSYGRALLPARVPMGIKWGSHFTCPNRGVDGKGFGPHLVTRASCRCIFFFSDKGKSANGSPMPPSFRKAASSFSQPVISGR